MLKLGRGINFMKYVKYGNSLSSGIISAESHGNMFKNGELETLVLKEINYSSHEALAKCKQLSNVGQI